MEENKKKKKRRIKFKGLLVIFLFIYLLCSVCYCVLKMPIKTIEITGNSYLKDNYLKDYLDINDEPIIKIRKKEIIKKLENLDLVKSAQVKKRYPFKIVITIEEEEALFYNNSTKKVVLASGNEVEYNKDYLGLPVLINYTPDDVYKEFIKYFSRVTNDNIALISEIKYDPGKVSEKIVDDKRFLFRMNDGNNVYINTINIEKFNDYLSIYERIVNKNGDVKGCLYLDSNSEYNHFDNCKELTGGNNGQN